MVQRDSHYKIPVSRFIINSTPRVEKLFDPPILSNFVLAPPRDRSVLVRKMKRTICLRLFDSHLNFALSIDATTFFPFFLFFIAVALACSRVNNFNLRRYRRYSGRMNNSLPRLFYYTLENNKVLSSLATSISLSVPCYKLAHHSDLF